MTLADTHAYGEHTTGGKVGRLFDPGGRVSGIIGPVHGRRDLASHPVQPRHGMTPGGVETTRGRWMQETRRYKPSTLSHVQFQLTSQGTERVDVPRDAPTEVGTQIGVRVLTG